MNELTKLIKPHVEELEREAKQGGEDARQVIILYNMHVKCPRDPGAPALCRAAFEKWQRDRS
jgi:hypothetical protein